jgi:prolyl-tRNA editing enzyme YbaK/EbsC (Cys-tRNA(Pro) deacylase)
MTTAAETFEVTGFRIGGVCPFGVDRARIWIDRGLRRFATIYPAAGTDASGVALTFDQLVAITNGEVCDVAG